MRNNVALARPVEAETRRLHERVRGHWNSVREQRLYPREEEIDPQLIKDAWDWCFLANMRKGGGKHGFHYDYVGSKLLEAFGTNLTGIEHCDAASLPHLASMLRHFDEVVESGEPALDESEFENQHRMRIKYRCCLLPLGNKKVEYILGCMRWKSE